MKFNLKFLNDLESILQKSGRILLSHFNKNIKYHFKNGQYVTEADIESENFLKEELGKILPNSSFIAEESGISGQNEYCWVIDPLDGTTNFVHGIPYFCISVALAKNDEIILGSIYNPINDEYFFAQKNGGSFLNRERIKVSSQNDLRECFISTSIPCGFKFEYGQHLELISKIRANCFGLRLMGAAALDLANVACGRFDASFFRNLKWWDVAAGLLLIQEADGIVTDFSGNVLNINFTSFVGGSRLIHENLIKNYLNEING